MHNVSRDIRHRLHECILGEDNIHFLYCAGVGKDAQICVFYAKRVIFMESEGEYIK